MGRPVHSARGASLQQRLLFRRFFKTVEARLTKALVRAQNEGALADGVESATAAHLLLCLVEGMRVVGKTGTDRLVSQATVETLINRFAK